MRADAKKNYEHLLAIAREVVKDQGAEASLRDIARKAGVGLGTLYRHFPTREALLETLLRESFDGLKESARERETASSPDDALVSWLRDLVACANDYRGVIAAMVAAIEDEESALHASCVTMKAAGTRLLVRAQEKGVARTDIDGGDLFAMVGALAWLGDQPSSASRADHLFNVITSAILKK
ncbi:MULTISPECIES: TetR/AcrR family transcriptional regulator [Thalassospira]|uniref:TetR family transcriptional regulator n=1 Tax=Thalassospira permensis NBRC 106175 TaxID=1353532 RepID=A0ABR4TL40_9PROT|nr:TetR/AcrR family transcriptional regulator [Thalassospira permensis]KEO54619.1 TetR family transcriptional regulator [Thalassospira permensis NBRC 106175]PTB84304.1 TetR/AcrR family transcriptional regulator [Marinobacter vinifirmus]